MRKVVLNLVIFVFLFGLVVSSAIAKEPDKRVEKSITKLRQVQDLLENGDQEEAVSILAEVKSEITQARFQVLAAEPERTLVGSQWTLEFSEELIVDTKINILTDEYHVGVGDATVENHADEERYARFDVYLLDPKGIQRKLTLSQSSSVLPGSSKYFSWFTLFEESKFIPGTYAILVKPNFESEPESLRFTIELNEEDFSE